MITTIRKQPKGGRPVKPVKKEIRAAVRFSKPEYYIIREKAAKVGVNISEYIRQIAIQGKINSRLSATELQMIRQLIGMSSNINQVARICHREGLYEAMVYFDNYRNQIDHLLQQLKS